MKLTALTLALLPLTLACTPATYQCSSPTSWSVCDTTGAWVPAGTCASDEYCAMNPNNDSPYCIPAPPPAEECSPGLFRCVEGEDGLWTIDACEEGKWEERVECDEGKVCVYGAVNGYPYCTDDPPY